MALRAALASVAVAVFASASAPQPSTRQATSLAHPLTTFFHFGPCTFVGCRYGVPWPPASSFAPPDDMDTDPWAEAGVYQLSCALWKERIVDTYNARCSGALRVDAGVLDGAPRGRLCSMANTQQQL